MTRLLRFLRPYWKASVVTLVMLVCMVAMDLAIPRLLQQLIDQGVARKDMARILNTCLIMIGVSVVGAVLAIWNTPLSVRVAQNFGADLRSALYRKIQTFSFGNLDHLQTGQLMVRLMSDVTAVQQVVLMSFNHRAVPLSADAGRASIDEGMVAVAPEAPGQDAQLYDGRQRPGLLRVHDPVQRDSGGEEEGQAASGGCGKTCPPRK